MRIEICPTADAAGARAARLIAEGLDAAIAERGRGIVALSGGRTPARMLVALASAPIAWPQIHVFQVDERTVDEDDDRRNMKALRAAFERADIPPGNLHRMPVDAASPERGAARYAQDLGAAAGTPPTLDVVHLGLGADGHTASLFPGDTAVEARGAVALSGPYEGVRRMTLTLHVLNRARLRVWLVTGAPKREAVGRLLRGDPEWIASRIRRQASILVMDRIAAGREE